MRVVRRHLSMCVYVATYKCCKCWGDLMYLLQLASVLSVREIMKRRGVSVVQITQIIERRGLGEQ